VDSRHRSSDISHGSIDRNKEVTSRTEEQSLGECPTVHSHLGFRRCEVDLVEAFPSFAIENQDLVCVAVIRAEAGDIELLVGAKYQALGPVEMYSTIAGQITGENVEEIPGMEVKAQNVTRKHVSCAEVTSDRDIDQPIRTQDYAAGNKRPSKTGGIEIAEELSGLEVELRNPSEGEIEVGYIQRRPKAADEAARCEWSV
jgi:hypothetical protein